MQALDEDQPGSKVLYKKLFEEDREYNQGRLTSSSFSSSSSSSSSAPFLLLLLHCELSVTTLQLFDRVCRPAPPTLLGLHVDSNLPLPIIDCFCCLFLLLPCCSSWHSCTIILHQTCTIILQQTCTTSAPATTFRHTSTHFASFRPL